MEEISGQSEAEYETEPEAESEPESEHEVKVETSTPKKLALNNSAENQGKGSKEEEKHIIKNQPKLDSKVETEHPMKNGSFKGQDKIQEIEAKPIEEAEGSDAYESEAEAELEVQSKEQPTFMNGSVQQSEAKPEPEPEIKKQQPVRNGNLKTQDQAPIMKKIPQKQQQQQLQPQPQRQHQPKPHGPRVQEHQQQPLQTQPQFQPRPQPLYQPKPQGPLIQPQQQQVQYPQLAPRAEGYRTHAIRESRIKDRPVKADAKPSAMSIKIELDLEVEVDLYARVKGDVTIGLM